MNQYFYTFDYMLDQSTQWRDELWDRYQNAPEGSEAARWYYKCWQAFNNAAAGLQRLIEAAGSGSSQPASKGG